MSVTDLKEIWRLVPSVPGVIASSWGRLMVIPYLSRRGTRAHYGGRPTYGQWDGDRFIYPFRGKTYKVARLICEAFSGPPPFARAVAMHGDENSRNNRPDNLSWGTQKQNLNAPGFLAYCRSRTGENSPTVKARRAA